MNPFIVIEFKERILSTHSKLKTYKLFDKVLIEIKSPRLLIHPPVAYSLVDKTLDIGLTPFVFVDSSGDFILYSIASENSREKLRSIAGSTYEFTALDNSSILVNEVIAGRILKILRASVDSATVEHVDMLNFDIYVKAVHPTIYNHAILLTEKNKLLKLALINEEPSIEFIADCNLCSSRKNEAYASTLCIDDSYLHAIVSGRVYGFYARLASEGSKYVYDVRQAYGYSINNVVFIKLGGQGYVLRLDKPSSEAYYSNFGILRPLAILSNNMLLGVTSKDGVIALVDLEKNVLNTIARADLGKLLDIDLDIEQSILVLTYDSCVYVFDVLENPKYIKLKSKDISSAILAKNHLIIFKKDIVEAYELDIASNRIYLEKVSSIPRYFDYCKTLVGDILLCVDKLGRIIVSRLEDVITSRLYQYTSLRSSLGAVTYLHRVLIPLTVSSAYEGKSIRVNSTSILLYVDDEEVLRHLAIYKNRTRFGTLGRVLIDVPEDVNDVHVLALGDKLLIDSKGSGCRYGYTYLSVVDGVKTTKIPLDTKSAEGLDNVSIFKNHTKIFLTREQGDIEFGIAIDKTRIRAVDCNNMLRYHEDRICLSDYLVNTLMSLEPVMLVAICSNTVIKSLDKCVDLRPCEKLLKLILKLGDETSFSIPIQQIATPRSMYVENMDKADVRYIHGLQYLLLPRKCVNIDQAFLRLERDNNVLVLSFTNRCKNVSAVVNVKNYVSPVEPGSRRDIEVEIGLDDMISDNGIHVLVLEGTGNILRYLIKLDLRFFIAKAISTALKIAKIVGVRAGAVKTLDHVRKDDERHRRKNPL